jgi:starvation-inducible outer membrane lipoprotein
MFRYLLIACTVLLTTACAIPLAPGVREKLDPDLDFAAVQADPPRFQGKALMLAGSIVTLRSHEQGSLLELLRWEVNRWGEPLALAEAGNRFLVRTGQPLDTDLYTRGRLVTLGATVSGTAIVTVNERDETAPLFELLEIHLWETPFRYGLHPNPDPSQPEYIAPRDPGPGHPYDPTPWAYPYSPYWYRNQ